MVQGFTNMAMKVSETRFNRLHVDLFYVLNRHLGRNVEVVLMKNCGHVPQLENPRLFNRIIKNFLKSDEPPSLKKAQVSPER